jgi:hypothetical protein
MTIIGNMTIAEIHHHFPEASPSREPQTHLLLRTVEPQVTVEHPVMDVDLPC